MTSGRVPRRRPEHRRGSRRARLEALAALVVLFAAAVAAPPARAGERPPNVFRTPPAEPGADPWVFKLEPEYRWRLVSVNPLELSGTTARNMFWGEQRLRLDVTAARAGIGAIFLQADVLDGVMFGDNGDFGTVPEVTSGLGIASKQPNMAGWNVALMDGRDPLEIDSYGPVLRAVPALQINYLYAEAVFPVGIVRAGRMPIGDIGGITTHDGRSRRNRWGVAFYHQAADRFLLATKISELFRMAVLGDNYTADRSMDRGVLLGVVQDFLVMDQARLFSDDLMQTAGQIAWRWPSAFHGVLRNFELSGTYAFRYEQRFRTLIFSHPLRLGFDIVWPHGLESWLRAEYTLIAGRTREISAGFAKLTSQAVQDQLVLSHGARAEVGTKVEDVSICLEWAYASGDEDPRSTTPQTGFMWARDANLGLLLFEHILAFESARSAAVGIENLKQVDAASFPLTEVATDGRVTNVNAIFPQVMWDPLDGVHAIRMKAGALFAFADRPVVDPIQSILAWDGDHIDDDAVNYAGGKPATYWGTEVDLGFEYHYADFFHFVLEGAVLFPGPALQDENGDAVVSWMLESRLVFAL